MSNKTYNIDGSDILIYNKKEYCIMYVGINKLGLVELPNLKLRQAVLISEDIEIPIHTVEQIRDSIENNENREAGYFGLYPQQYKAVKEALKE